jgi:hypothetical protein
MCRKGSPMYRQLLVGTDKDVLHNVMTLARARKCQSHQARAKQEGSREEAHMLKMKLLMPQGLQVLVQVHKRGVKRVEVCLGQKFVSVQHNLVQRSRALKRQSMSKAMRSSQPQNSMSTSHTCRAAPYTILLRPDTVNTGYSYIIQDNQTCDMRHAWKRTRANPTCPLGRSLH